MESTGKNRETIALNYALEPRELADDEKERITSWRHKRGALGYCPPEVKCLLKHGDRRFGTEIGTNFSQEKR